MSSSGGQVPALIASGDSLPAPTALPVDAFTYILDDTSSTWRRFLSARSLADGDAGAYYPAVASRLKSGGNFDVARTPAVFKVITTLAVGAEATIWTPAGGKKFRLMGFMFFLSASVFFVLKDNTAGTTIWRGAGGTAAATPTASPPGMGNGILSAAANNVLTMTSSGAANLDGVVFGTEE